MISAHNLSADQCLGILLKILMGNSSGCDFSHLTESDWSYIMKLVRWHRVARPTLSSIIDSNIVVPDDFLINLQELSKNNAANNLTQIALLPKIKESLSNQEIPFLFLKGIFLSMQLHQSFVERHSKDIDIWVAEDHVLQAVQALQSAGFKLVKPCIELSNQEVKSYMVNQKDMVLVSTGSIFVEIELHWRLDKNRYCFPLSFNDAYLRREKLTINDDAYPTISLIDNYFYLSSHGTNALYGRLKWLLDWQSLCNLIETNPQLISQVEVIKYAKTMPAQFRQMSLSYYLLKKLNNQHYESSQLFFVNYSVVIKTIADIIIKNWANLSYMKLIKRWCLRFFLVKSVYYKVEQIRLAIKLLCIKLFFKKGVYE